MRLGYNGEIHPSMVKDLVLASQETGLRFVMYVYGVGDHGGGPTKRDVLYSREMNVWPVFPKIQLSGAQVFFDRLAKEGAGLPTLDCELNYEFTGCYTTQTVVKRANRFGEKKLLDAEAAATLASGAAKCPYPKEELLEAWRDTLFNHFHDILPGSGVHDTRTYTHGLYQKTVATTSMEETQALRTLASKVDTTGPDLPVSPDMPVSSLMTAMGSGVGFGSVDGGLSSAEQSSGQGPRPILVFNPTAVERKEVVEVVVWDNAWGWRRHELRNIPFSVQTPKGDLIPAQTLDVGHYWGHDFVRLAFPVSVGSLGYGVYTVIEGPCQGQESQVKHLGIGHHCSYAFYERSPEGLENEWLRLEVNPATAGIQSLIHKPSGKAIICSCDEAPVLEYAMERPHGMTAWTVDHTGPAERLEVLSLSRRQAGPYKATLEARMRIRESEFSLTYELRKEDPNLYIHIDGTWFERGSHHKGIPMLRAAFPFALDDIRTRYEIPFGGIERNTEHGEEVPALSWAEVSGLQGDEPMGCLLLNDSKHGHSIDGNRLRLTLIRSSYDPDPLPEIGRHEIHLALRPFVGAMSDAEAIRIGQAFNHELRCVSTDVHKGKLAKAASLVRVSPSVVVSGIKMAEEDRSMVLRVFEPNGKSVTAKVDLDREALGEVQKAQEVDLMERPLAQSSAEVKSTGCVTVKVPSRGISSIKIRMK
jgi:alpha-mannosidase